MNLLETAIQCKKYFENSSTPLVLHKHSIFEYTDLENLCNKGVLFKQGKNYFPTSELDYFIKHNGKTQKELFKELKNIIDVLSCTSVDKNLRSELEKILITLISDTEYIDMKSEYSKLSVVVNKIKDTFPTIKSLIFTITSSCISEQITSCIKDNF